MTFNTALSGLRAANTDLEVTGNNIANASTTGFKRSRAEFSDVYANSLVGGTGSSVGSGVLVGKIAQQFSQGNIAFTDNSLDLAINGSGFFILQEPSGSTVYTRAGLFGLNDDGFIVSNTGALLQGFLPSEDGTGVSGTPPSALKVEVRDIAPKATDRVNIQFNLDARASAPTVTPFNPTDANTFNSSSSLTIYDSLGQSHILTTYYVKTSTNNQWQMYTYIPDDNGVLQNVKSTGGGATPFYQLNFNTDGSFASSTPATVTVNNWNPTGANQSSTAGGTTTTSDFNIVLNNSSQFGSEFAVSEVTQTGFASGQLTGLSIDGGGQIFARYTNGQSQILGQVAMVDFSNEQGLAPEGDTYFSETFSSGAPVVGAPLTGTLGAIQSGSLEESNVDLSEELVRLIIAQRNFQANAQTIETADTVTQAIINIR